MGLSITVGIIAALKSNKHSFNTLDPEALERMRKEFKRINRLIVKQGISDHVEPEDVVPWSCDMIGYDGLHFLRRVAANLALKGVLPAPATRQQLEDADSAKDQALLREDVEAQFSTSIDEKAPHPRYSHLMLHADHTGVYLPIDFRDVVLRIPKKGDIETIGSCYRLLEECEILATSLNIPTQLDAYAVELQDAVEKQDYSIKTPPVVSNPLWKAYGIETYTCIQLMRACRNSIDKRCAIVFH